jgi:cytosine/adenosine deaminase-related metal-dependent hydrolase
MADLLVSGGTVLTMDGARRVIEDGAVAVSGGRIVAVGPRAEVAAVYPAPRVIDATRRLVMPGLIDVHAHAGHGLIKSMGIATPGAWEELCGTVYTVGSTPEFWRAEAELAALERLRFGVTTGVSLLGGGDTIMRSDRPDHAAAHAEGVVAVGVREVLAIGPTRPPHPRTYAEWIDGERHDRPVGFEEQLATSLAVLREWHDTHDGRIRVALLTPVLRDEHVGSLGPVLLAEATEQTKRVRALAREAGVVFTQDGHWKGSIRRAAEMGILGPGTLLSHCIDIDADEIALVAETGTAVAHNPSAVASILGRCPAIELMEAGAIVALGSDATAPDRSADMFRHIQQAMHYHRTHFRDPSVLPAGKALEMATVDGAAALGLAHEIGSLEPGKCADIVLLDLARPHLAPFNMAPLRAAAFANGNDVHTVIVGGEVVLDDRRATRVDEAAIIAAADREAGWMIERTGSRALLDLPAAFFGATRYGNA